MTEEPILVKQIAKTLDDKKAIGIIALPICVAYNLYNIAKAGAALGKSSF